MKNRNSTAEKTHTEKNWNSKILPKISEERQNKGTKSPYLHAFLKGMKGNSKIRLSKIRRKIVSSLSNWWGKEVQDKKNPTCLVSLRNPHWLWKGNQVRILASCLAARSHFFHMKWLKNWKVISYISFHYPDHICPTHLPSLTVKSPQQTAVLPLQLAAQ